GRPGHLALLADLLAVLGSRLLGALRLVRHRQAPKIWVVARPTRLVTSPGSATRARPTASNATRICRGKPNTNTLICGADLARRASRICVANSTTMTGAAISTAAAKNVVTSPVITLATVPMVTWGRV